MTSLALHDAEVSYGGLAALRDIKLELRAGEIIGVAGPNGAGKSSLLRAIAGLIRLSAGTIQFDGEMLSDASTGKFMRVRDRVQRGICLVPEGRGLFPGLTVEEHLKFGAYLVGSRSSKADMDRVYAIFPKLDERRGHDVTALSGGEKQMVAIGRALMSRPKLLMIDELALGLAPIIVSELMKAISEINAETGLSVVLVDESVGRLGNSVSRIVFLRHGGIQAVRSPDDAKSEVAALYLGAD